MRRSRSSFDLSDAITSAEALSPRPPAVPEADAVATAPPLVAFDSRSVAPGAPPAGEDTQRTKRRLAPPPSLEGALSVGDRCDRLLEWLRSDPHTTNVLLVDAEGLPLAHASSRDEAMFGAAAAVASAIRQLALASPGSLSREFESHVGDRPILSLVGFMVGAKLYVVGLTHEAPLGADDAATIRTAFTSALAALHGAEAGNVKARGVGNP
jgi:hypothetical protein